MAANSPTLSVAMIVGQENTPDGLLEAVVRQQLSFADEVVCVVSVPSDGTWTRLVKGIFGQWRNKLKLVPRPWQGNYALQRNIALAECGSDVVLTTDCDEWWPPELTNDWRKVWAAALEQGDDVDGVAFPTRHYGLFDDGSMGLSATVDWHTRLFRNDPRIFWDGRLHEQVRSLRRVVQRDDLYLHHFGWAREEAVCQARLDRRNAHDRALGRPGDVTLRGPGGPWESCGLIPDGVLPGDFDTRWLTHGGGIAP